MPLRVVFFDRDDTLIENVPYNGDPERVVAMRFSYEALARLRANNILIAVVTNQSGVGRGWITLNDVDAVNARVEALLGPVAAWFICPHAPVEGCACRKPAPGLLLRALQHFDLTPAECAMVGDSLADMEAARAAGIRGILVPSATPLREILEGGEMAEHLLEAVDMLLESPMPRGDSMI